MLEAKSHDGMRSARGVRIGTILLTIFILPISAPSVRAQTSPVLRKVVFKVAPKYPRKLRQNAIGATVRLSVSVNPHGSVVKITTVGGNPVLVDAATQAVKQWKYAPSDHSTTTEVQLDFIPHQQ